MGTRKMKAALMAAAFGAASVEMANAAVSFNESGYSQNFDTLLSQTATNTATTGSATTSIALGTATGTGAIAGLDNWYVARSGATTATSINLVANNGSSNTGALYSFGAVNTTDRALGSVASSSQIPVFGVVLTNTSANALQSVTISFNEEQWRIGAATTGTTLFGSETYVDEVRFAYGVSTGALSDANFLTSTDMTSTSSLSLSGIRSATSGANTAMSEIAMTATITFDTPIASGGTFFLRWADSDSVGSDAGVGLDDLTINGTFATPEPSSLALVALGTVGTLRRRRRQQTNPSSGLSDKPGCPDTV